MLIEAIIIKTEYKEFVKYKKSKLKIDNKFSQRSEEVWKYSKKTEVNYSQAEEINRWIKATSGNPEDFN